MKKSLLTAGLALSVTLVLTGCGQAESEGLKTLAEIEKQYPAVIKHDGDVIEGGILKIGVVSDSGFKGIFNPFFYTDGVDHACMGGLMDGAFPVDENFKSILDSDETPINIHVDADKMEVTYKINPKFKWSDGSNVTTDDIIKTYEIVANPTFIQAAQSPRFSSDMYIIQGINDYNEGKADKISGLEKISDSEMKIHLTEMNPGVYYGGPFASAFVQAKSLEGVPMDKILESDAFRKNPPSYGPFVIDSIVSGERVSYKPNPYYYKGAPKVAGVEVQIIPSSQSVASIKSGSHHLYRSVGSDVFDQIKDLKNISIGVQPDLYLAYMGFNQGTWDEKNNVVVTNPDAKMNNVALKKALAHAIDNKTLGEKFYSGLRFPATSPIAPVFTDYFDPSNKGIPFDPEAAKKLLDEAGYKDVDGDGFREDPKGEQLVLHLGMMAGGEISEPLSQYYLDSWKNIGIKAELTDGRLLEFNDFYDRVQANDPGIDVYMAAFGLASDPNPTGLWGAHEPFNLGRYTSEKLESSLQALSSPEALDPKKEKELYREFDKVFAEELPAVPMMNRVDFAVVNKAVKYYDARNVSPDHWDLSKIELTSDAPKAE